MSNPAFSRVTYMALVVANLVVGALILEIGRGSVPIPETLKWTIPILLALLNGVSLFLPRWGSERLSQQVDILREQGVPRSEMRVVDGAVPLPTVDTLSSRQVDQITDELLRRRV